MWVSVFLLLSLCFLTCNRETHLWVGEASGIHWDNKQDSICCEDPHTGRCHHQYKVRPYDLLVENISSEVALPTWGRRALSGRVGPFHHWGGGWCEISERVELGTEGQSRWHRGMWWKTDLIQGESL